MAKSNGRPKLPRVAFMERTQGMLYAHAKRCLERRDKRGRLMRPAIPVEVSLPDFRQWVLGALQGDAGGYLRCGFECGAVVDIHNLSLDLATPLSRGGRMALDNFVLCCDTCNRIKGKLTEAEYRAFRKGMDTFSEPARNDIYNRLKTGGGFTRVRFFKKAQPTAPPDPAAAEDDF